MQQQFWQLGNLHDWFLRRLEFLNSFVDSDSVIDLKTKNILRGLVMNVLDACVHRRLIKDLKDSSTTY